MKNNNIVITILIVIAIGVAIWLLFVDTNGVNNNNGDKLTVGATIFPLYDITREIAGSSADVIQILPAGASPHTYELTPSDIKNLDGADTVFKIGNSLDDWADDITDSLDDVTVKSVDSGITLIKFADEHEHEHGDEHEDEEHEHEHGDHDPHYWLSVDNAKKIANNIATQLKTSDPDNADNYETNLNSYLEELDELKTEVKESLSSIESPAIITFHDSYAYFAEEFGITIAGVFQVSPGTEPTPGQLTELQELVDEYSVPALFSEPQMSDDVIKPFADDVELPVYEMDPLGGVSGRQSYVELIKYNADTIINAY